MTRGWEATMKRTRKDAVRPAIEKATALKLRDGVWSAAVPTDQAARYAAPSRRTT